MEFLSALGGIQIPNNALWKELTSLAGGARSAGNEWPPGGFRKHSDLNVFDPKVMGSGLAGATQRVKGFDKLVGDECGKQNCQVTPVTVHIPREDEPSIDFGEFLGKALTKKDSSELQELFGLTGKDAENLAKAVEAEAWEEKEIAKALDGKVIYYVAAIILRVNAGCVCGQGCTIDSVYSEVYLKMRAKVVNVNDEPPLVVDHPFAKNGRTFTDCGYWGFLGRMILIEQTMAEAVARGDFRWIVI